MPIAKKFSDRERRRTEAEPVCLSPVRRVDRVAAEERVCAITFDDGPCGLPALPDRFRGKPLTLVLAEILEHFGARGTFCVVGDTVGNYPDRPGKPGSPSWNGLAFDHLPDFGQDVRGGVVHCPELISRLLAGGHEIAGHSYTHVPFGRTSLLRSGRRSQPDLEAVLADLRRLHRAMETGWGYPLRLSRPPRRVDAIKGGFTSYDAFALMGVSLPGLQLRRGGAAAPDRLRIGGGGRLAAHGAAAAGGPGCPPGADHLPAGRLQHGPPDSGCLLYTTPSPRDRVHHLGFRLLL